MLNDRSLKRRAVVNVDNATTKSNYEFTDQLSELAPQFGKTFFDCTLLVQFRTFFT